jgi:hypothetical protein
VIRRAADGRSPARRACRGALGCLLAVASLSPAARADELEPFAASYEWIWHGMSVAVSSLELAHTGDTWTYRSHSEPRGIGKLFPERPTQVSVMRITPAGVEPLSYRATAGGGSTRRDVEVTFDWPAGRVTGVYEGAKVDLGLEPGIQDDSSIQIALMVELLRGHIPSGFTLLNGNSVRRYRYTREGEATLRTPLGEVATVVYRSEHQGSPRVTRFWCAPAHGYIPMRVEQTRGAEVEWTMKILTLKRE